MVNYSPIGCRFIVWRLNVPLRAQKRIAACNITYYCGIIQHCRYIAANAYFLPFIHSFALFPGNCTQQRKYTYQKRYLCRLVLQNL